MVIFKLWSEKLRAVQNAKYFAEIYHLNYSIEILQIVFGIITVMKKYFVSFLKTWEFIFAEDRLVPIAHFFT